jgi:hypothetical protein
MRKFLLGAHSEPEKLRPGVVILRELMQGKFYERFRPKKSRLRLTNGAKPGKKKKKKTCFRFQPCEKAMRKDDAYAKILQLCEN